MEHLQETLQIEFLWGHPQSIHIWSQIHKIVLYLHVLTTLLEATFKKEIIFSISLCLLLLCPLSLSILACQFLLKKYISVTVLCQPCLQGWTQESDKISKISFLVLYTKVWKNKKRFFVFFFLGLMRPEKVRLGPTSSYLSCYIEKILR